MTPRKHRQKPAVSIRPRKDLVARIERELRRSKVTEGAIAGAMTAVRVILKKDFLPISMKRQNGGRIT
jgi:hypothetical protein